MKLEQTARHTVAIRLPSWRHPCGSDKHEPTAVQLPVDTGQWIQERWRGELATQPHRSSPSPTTLNPARPAERIRHSHCAARSAELRPEAETPAAPALPVRREAVR